MNLTIYTDKLPPNVGGCANGPIIRIRPKYKDDTGIHKHEAVHVKQWWTFVAIGVLVAVALYQTGSEYWMAALIAGAATHSLLYLTIPAYKLWAEVQAYKEQARWYEDDRRPLFAAFIATDYGLNITQEDALKRLNHG